MVLLASHIQTIDWTPFLTLYKIYSRWIKHNVNLLKNPNRKSEALPFGT